MSRQLVGPPGPARWQRRCVVAGLESRSGVSRVCQGRTEARSTQLVIRAGEGIRTLDLNLGKVAINIPGRSATLAAISQKLHSATLFRFPEHLSASVCARFAASGDL